MRRIVLLSIAVVVVVLAIASQFVLPAIAAQQLRDRLARSGKVLDVEVDAFPAIELLWHQADRVVIRMASYRSSPGHLDSLLADASNVGSLDASARVLDTGLLALRNATLSKRGSTVTGSATVTESDLRTALPILQSVVPVASGGGQLTLRGTASLPLLGDTTVDATVKALNGALVVAPDVPFGALATLTLFSNRSLYVDAVGASPAAGGFTVTARGRVR